MENDELQLRKTHEESARVGQQYMERFGHPAYHRYVSEHGAQLLTTEQSLQLMQDALTKGEPVPGWAEAYESNKVVWGSKGALT